VRGCPSFSFDNKRDGRPPFSVFNQRCPAGKPPEPLGPPPYGPFSRRRALRPLRRPSHEGIELQHKALDRTQARMVTGTIYLRHLLPGNLAG